jgi:ribosomal protein S8
MEIDITAEIEGIAISGMRIATYLQPQGYIKKYLSKETRDSIVKRKNKNGKIKILFPKRYKNKTTITITL